MSATFVFPSGRLPRYGYAFARNDKAVRVYAWSVICVRVSSFLLYGISQLTPLNDNVYATY